MFSRTSEYALRALIELAREEEDRPLLAADLAERVGGPSHYVAKVLQQLARKGVLSSQRGRQGGFRLAVDATEVTAWDVVRHLDDLGELERCVLGEAECSDARACPLHALWVDIRGKFTGTLRATTLRHLADFGGLSDLERLAQPPGV